LYGQLTYQSSTARVFLQWYIFFQPPQQVHKKLTEDLGGVGNKKSKDSSPSHIHFHHPRLADVFEDFNRPHTSLVFTPASHNHPSSSSTAAAAATASASAAAASASATNVPPSYLPVEDIYVLPQYQPVNPEDEDDVVPDQHAAFGITRAMDNRRQLVWRDLGLEELMRGVRQGVGKGSQPKRRAANGGRVVCLR